MSAPPASIIVPLRVQRDDWLEQSLRSALDQTVPAEVVVVTADDTPLSNLDVITRLAPESGERLRVLERQKIGFAVALNQGIRAARAERIGFLFSDDWLAPEALEVALAEQADIVSGGKQIWVDRGDGRPPEHVYQFIGSESAYARLQTDEERARYITHFLLLRRALVEAVGGVDESLGDLSGVDDFDLIWTLLEHGATVAFTEGASYRLRDHAGPRLTLRPGDEQRASLRRMLNKHRLDPRLRDRVISAHSRWFGRTIDDVLAETRPARRDESG